MVEVEEPEEETDSARNNNSPCFLSGLPASRHNLKLDCHNIPSADDVDFLFSNYHTRPSTAALAHLWVKVPADVLDRVSFLLPRFPSLYPHLSHCHVRFDRYDK